MRHLLLQLLAAQAVSHDAMGSTQPARERRAAWRQVQDDIAAGIIDPDLRITFYTGAGAGADE